MNKRFEVRIIIFFSIIGLTQCAINISCPDNLTPLFNKISYKNNQIITFVNDLGIVKYDTVHIKNKKVPDHITGTILNRGGDGEYDDCTGIFYVNLGDFKICGIQDCQHCSQNGAGINTYFFSYQYSFKSADTTFYLYNDKKIEPVLHYMLDTAYFEHNYNSQKKIIKYCNEYYISLNDYRLLFYSIIENDIKTNWRLK